MTLHAYLPQDRLRALMRGESLPDRANGFALFADISGFTPLTEKLTLEFGVRRGIEELTQRINHVYDAMIDEVDRFNGSVVSFAGDAITCWFDDNLGDAVHHAVSCAQALQDVLTHFPDLSVKIAVSTGSVRRFAIGDPAIQLMDTLAGETISRLSLAEQIARAGEIILDPRTAQALEISGLPRRTAETGDEFSILDTRIQRPKLVITPALEVLETPGTELIKPWILPVVFERETAGHELLLTELRPTTAIFIRFTGLDYDNDPKAWEKLDAVVSRSQRILDRHEGSLLELTIGDKGSYMYASFGATHIHENDSLRAIRAAFEIKDQFKDSEFPETLQIGVSSGMMRVGGYGGRNRKSFGAMGNGVNLAARLMVKAAPDEVLVSGRVQKAGVDEFVFEARPPMNIKGWAEPVPVFAVLGIHQHRAIRLKEPSYPLPMIGRESELNLIAAKIESVRKGKGQIVGITGEAGMGKSRLVAEAIRLSRQNKLLGYGGACQSDGIHTPYLVWNSIWNAYFDLDPAMPLRKLIRKIEGELEDSVPEHLDALPLLGSILGLPLPENDFTQSLQPADRKSQLETMLVKCLQYTAKEATRDESGLLFVLEDLHWIDPVSIDLLGLVARVIENLPVLILLTYRPPDGESHRHELAPFAGMDHFTEIKLSELNPGESEQAIRAKLAQLFPEHRSGVPHILIQRITERAQGNPFYVEELLNYMRDRGIDPHDVDTVKALELPTSLHSLILSRIDQLTSSQQLTLKVASIIGRIFRFDHLHNYYPSLGPDERVRSDLQALQRIDLTPLESPEPELAYQFKHLVTHEVSYESIAFATRRQLHGQYANFLETTYADQIEKLIAQLAHHYERAGVQDKARHYLAKAGEQAATNFANEEALAYFNRALSLTDTTTRRFQFDTLMKRERVYDLLGKRKEQRQDLDDLNRMTGEFEDTLFLRTQLAIRRARLEIDEGNFSEAMASAHAAFQELNENVSERDRSPDLLVDALWLEARAMFYAGQAVAAKPQLERALGLARAHHYLRGEYNIVAQLGLWYWYNGDNESALNFLEQSLALTQKAGDIRREQDMRINLGIIAKDMYHFDTSLAHYEQAQAIAKKIGDRSGEASLLNNIGRVNFVMGDFAQAAEYCKHSAEVGAEVNDRMVQGLALFNQSEAYRALGQYQSAKHAAEESLKLLRFAGYRLGEADTLEVLALIEFSLGARPRALELVEKALEIGREIAARRVEISALTRLGWMRLEMGQIELAEEVFLKATKIEEMHKEAIAEFELKAGLATAALARGDSKSLEAAHSLVQDLVNEILQEPFTDQSHILPLRLYLTCIRVLQANADPRTRTMITRANKELQAHYEKISAVNLRTGYLEIPEHRAITEYASRLATQS